MQELQAIYDKYKFELLAYNGNKNTILGKLNWTKFREEKMTAFADELDAKCTELANGNSDELKKEANRLFTQLRLE